MINNAKWIKVRGSIDGYFYFPYSQDINTVTFLADAVAELRAYIVGAGPDNKVTLASKLILKISFYW